MDSRPLDHGTRNGYANQGCRCDECTRANRAYMREYRAGRRPAGEPVLVREEPEHGTRSRYVHRSCRCEPCKEANREYSRIWMSRHRTDAYSYDDTYGGLLP